MSDAKSTPDNSMDEGRGLERGCGGVVIIIIISYGEQVGKEEEEEQGEAL